MSQEIINQCTVEGNVVKLPPIQLDRNTYTEVANKLQKIGGKWNRKFQGFVFDYNPSDLLADLQEGKDRNIKKEFQFFETPVALADQLVELSELRAHHSVLEPSAGRGAIIDAIHRNWSLRTVDCFELMPENQQILRQNERIRFLGSDFLESDTLAFDRIIANPPFSKNQDIDHIRKMYAVLVRGGILVSVASTHWRYSSNRKESEFRQWLDEVNAEIIDVPEGTFKESGTNITTVIIKIKK